MVRASSLIPASLFLFAVAGLAADRPAAFGERHGKWVVAGDSEAGGCVAWHRDSQATKLTIFALPSTKSLRFILENPAWKSLDDRQGVQIQASFFNAQGKMTNLWDLNAVGSSGNDPKVHFDISYASNDGESFSSNFSTANEVLFTRDQVPIAQVDLARSSAAIEALKRCRVKLQLEPDFDPFKK